MTDEDIDDTLDEYDHLLGNVLNSGHQNFVNHLQRLVAFLEHDPTIAPYVSHVANSVDFEPWLRKC